MEGERERDRGEEGRKNANVGLWKIPATAFFRPWKCQKELKKERRRGAGPRTQVRNAGNGKVTGG